MSTKTETETDTGQQTPTESTEVIEIDGGKIIETIENMVDKQSISRLIIYKRNGDVFLDLSFAAGLTMALLTTFLLPQLLGLGIIGALLGGFKIEVVRRVEPSIPEPKFEIDLEVASSRESTDSDNKRVQGQK